MKNSSAMRPELRTATIPGEYINIAFGFATAYTITLSELQVDSARCSCREFILRAHWFYP
jgi:hypothetical protein